MSLVLFDAPGPRTRRRVTIGSVAAGLVLAVIVVIAALRLADRGIFDGDRWDIFLEDTQVWHALLVRGLGATLRAAAVAAAFALAGGGLLVVARISAAPWLRMPATVIIELFRGLPVLLLMLFAAIGFGASIFQAVVIGLAIYNAAVIAEILRAGLASLPAGQREAALAIGLTPAQALRMILLPQAVRRMLPSLVSQLVVLLKDTSLGFIVGYSELLRTSRELRDFFGSKYIFSIFVVTATIYIGVNFLLSSVAHHLERRSAGNASGGVAPRAETGGEGGIGSASASA
jgi:glutamate transport system permease protein